MAQRFDIVHIQFQANAAKANAALDSMRVSAKSCDEAILRVTRDLEAAKAANFPTAQIDEMTTKLRKLETQSRQWHAAINASVKGVAVLDQAILAFNNGTLEQMNVQLSKTARNAAQLQMNRATVGTREWQEMKVLVDELDKNILRGTNDLKTMYDTIKGGGTIAYKSLKEAETSLKGLMEATTRGTQEWRGYKTILTEVQGAMTRSSEIEKQLAGEIVTIADAERVLAATDKDRAAKMVAAAEEEATLQQRRLTTINLIIASHERLAAAEQESLVKINEEAIALTKDVTALREAEAAKQALNEANKQLSSAEAELTRLQKEEAGDAAKITAQEEKIREAKLKVADATERLAAAESAAAKARKNGSLETQEKRLEGLNAKRQQHVNTITREEQEMQRLGQLALDAGDKQTMAEQRAAQASNLTIEHIEQAIQVLRKQQKTADSVSYQKMETEIEQLAQRMEEMRGRAMSMEDALKLSATAGGKGFTGTATQLKLAETALVKASEAAKKGSPEWAKYQEALAKVRLEMNNAGITSERMREILAKPADAKNLNELSAAVKRAKAELDLMAGTVGKNSAEYKQLADQTKKAEFQLKELQSAAKGTASAFDKAWSRLKTYIGLYMGAAVAIQKLTGALGDLMELSDKMGEVRKTTGYTADEVGRLSDSLAKLDTRTPIQELLGLSAAAGQLGLKAQDDVRGFTEAANKLIVALPEMGRESATSLMKIANATGDLKRNGGDVQETLERVGSTIISLRANSASAAGPITDFVSRVGAVGAQAGITIDQIAAMGSTIDALGGRVEMSATALSRMIPAIRNNAFGVANAIGVTEKTLTDLFNQGKAMEAMVLIFQKMRDSVKQFDTSTEEGMNAMANNVEELLGKDASMAEVMKELNQQGARAGIVFGLMSQNVDELSRQLNIASEAYRDNTSLLNEYNNMNETTAAKWARLKNQIEEMFVADAAQRRLGWIIDRLRWVVDFISGNLNPALNVTSTLVKSIAIAWAVTKVGAGGALMAMISWVLNLRTNIIKLTDSFKAFYAANKANVWFAIAAAVIYAANAFYELSQKVSIANQAMQDAENTFEATRREVGSLFTKLTDAINKQKDFKSSTKALKEEEASLQVELENLRKKLGEGAEKSDEFKKKQNELEEAHKKVAEAEGKAAEETSRRLGVIKEINDKYSTYLGYMLSEASTAETVASAHDLIVASLKEEMYWREQNNAFQTVNQKHQEKLQKFQEKSLAEINDLNPVMQQNIMADWQRTLSGAKYDAQAGGFVLKGGVVFKDLDDAVDALKDVFTQIIAKNVGANWATLEAGDYWGGWADDGFRDWTKESLKVLQETATLQKLSGSAAEKAHEDSVKRAKENTDALIAQTQGDGATTKQMAEAIVGIQKNFSKYGEVASEYTQFTDTSLKGIANVLLKDVPADTRKAVMAEMERVAARGIGGNVPTKTTGDTNPYGGYDRVTDPYEKWDANALVARRKEMLERVRALANGADVQAVLSEDAKFISEATRKNIKDTRQAIEWYNTERLKIQEALHARYLTNTGDWMDPKKGGRKASKMVQDEMKYYLDELDAYYTERKAKIQEAQNDELISEAEARNRTLANEAEWQQRRGHLQQLYSKKRKEVAKDEQDAIFGIIAERTGDSTDYIKKSVKQTVKFIEKVGAEKGKPAMDKIYGDIDLDMEKSFLRQRNAIGKHLQAITDIINKENPFNGITDNLRKNLGTMDILLADIKKEEERTVGVEIERTMFLLEQAKKGYSLTWEELMREMARNGWKAWADEIEASPALQSGLMHQIHKTFESVQDAIRKEASQLKKDADIMWSNLLVPGGDGTTTVKDVFEQSIAKLGVQEASVSRANSLIGAGQRSERLADKLAIQQMKVQLAMQQYQYDLVRKTANEKIKGLEKEAKMYEDLGNKEKARALKMQAENTAQALNLATRKEETEVLKQQQAIIAKTEESENKLYKELRDWVSLVSSSVQSLFEASNTGNADYYNERAKLQLTGGSGETQDYIIIDNAGTEDATAHYETLTELEYLERKHEIDQKNATADAFKKVMDDINQKLNDTITDQINAMFQNQAVDDNTAALMANTNAIYASMGVEAEEGQPLQPELPLTPKEPEEPLALMTHVPEQGSVEIPATPTGADQANTDATNANTVALNTLTQMIGGQPNTETPSVIATAGMTTAPTNEGGETAMPAPFFQMTDEEQAKAMERIQQLWQAYNDGGVEALQEMAATLAETEGIVLPPWQITDQQLSVAMERMQALWQAYAEQGIEAMQTMSDAMDEMPNKIPNPLDVTEEQAEASAENMNIAYQGASDASSAAAKIITDNLSNVGKTTKDTNDQMAKGSQSTFAKMTQAANLYGIAYQAMSNDNLTTEQKFEMIALQAAGNAAMAGLTAAMSEATGKTAANEMTASSKAFADLGPVGGAVAVALITAVLGGLMGFAMSKVAKSKSEIAQATGASSSASVGRLSTGMLTYAEGNVNEFSDPGSLTPGRSYNVDAADGRTYRARYTGRNPKTHITNGPEFHLSGERGREMIIDAGTTQQIVMNETGIWKAIQTISGGGRIRHLSALSRRGRGMAAFADGNLKDFGDIAALDGSSVDTGTMDLSGLQSSIDRQSELLEDLRVNGIQAHFQTYGKDGLVDSYDTAKRFLKQRGWDY